MNLFVIVLEGGWVAQKDQLDKQCACRSKHFPEKSKYNSQKGGSKKKLHVLEIQHVQKC